MTTERTTQRTFGHVPECHCPYCGMAPLLENQANKLGNGRRNIVTIVTIAVGFVAFALGMSLLFHAFSVDAARQRQVLLGQIDIINTLIQQEYADIPSTTFDYDEKLYQQSLDKIKGIVDNDNVVERRVFSQVVTAHNYLLVARLQYFNGVKDGKETQTKIMLVLTVGRT